MCAFESGMFLHTGTYVGLEIDLDDVAEVCVCAFESGMFLHTGTYLLPF